EAAPSVVIPSAIGRRVPPHCTALGKVLLAQNQEAMEELLAKGPLPALTPNTITNPELLRRELEQVRKQGYAIDWEEFHEGNICVAAPVRNYRGKVVAAISISLPKARLTHDSLDRFVQAVVRGAHEVSSAIGYR
ncbi:MAG: IclR family transcriptional regulator C-terminal domain-containing protein, partial [Candidatus Bathyarchaeia archaeon]